VFFKEEEKSRGNKGESGGKRKRGGFVASWEYLISFILNCESG